MIVLDPHVWVWWVDNNSRLTDQLRQIIIADQPDGLTQAIDAIIKMQGFRD